MGYYRINAPISMKYKMKGILNKFDMKIEIKDIRKKYRDGKKKVLKNITFEANSGQCIGILGTNGCGKTTLLSILAGINKADSGEFLIDGQNAFSNKNIIKEKVGYVPQGNPLMEELTALDNLKLWYCDSGLNLENELENGVLKMLGIDEFAKVRVSKMSGGMKKRLSIGCAVANRPAIMILDEPGASLDVVCKEQIDSYLRRFKQAGGIIIITTHEEREIELCDSVYILKEGTLEPYEYQGIEELIKKL